MAAPRPEMLSQGGSIFGMFGISSWGTPAFSVVSEVCPLP